MDTIKFKDWVEADKVFSDERKMGELYGYMVVKITHAVKNKSDFLNLFIFEKEDQTHILFYNDYYGSLGDALEFFVKNEEYEKCAEIKKTMDLLK